MVWTQPMTFTANTVLTAAQMNVHVRDNFLASEAAQIQEAQDYIVAGGYHQLSRRQVKSNTILTSEQTKTTEYSDLSQSAGTSGEPVGGTTGTVGPAVTVETGSSAWVILTAHMQNSLALSRVYMSYTVTRPAGPIGPDGEPISQDQAGTPGTGEGGEREADDRWALIHDGLSAGGSFRRSYVDFLTDLTPGENTFTCKYRTGAESNTATFTNRQIIVIPM
jgi:hypothetical protein